MPAFKDFETLIVHVTALETVTDGFSAYKSLRQGERSVDEQKRALKADVDIVKSLIMRECEKNTNSLQDCESVEERCT